MYRICLQMIMLLSSMYLTSFTSSYFFRIYKIRGTHPSARNADNSRHTGMRMRRLVNQKRTPLLSPPPQLLPLVLTLLALILPLLPFLLAWASMGFRTRNFIMPTFVSCRFISAKKDWNITCSQDRPKTTFRPLFFLPFLHSCRCGGLRIFFFENSKARAKLVK